MINFEKGKGVLSFKNLQLYFRQGLKLKKMHRVLEFIQSQCLKPFAEVNAQKRKEIEEKSDKEGKVL